jgi:hypothetical protein
MRRFCTVLLITVLLCLIFSGCELAVELDWGYAETVPVEEAQLRDQYVATAVEWLNKNSLDGSHKEIIDLYNAHEPLAVGYAVKYDDQWCATFVSAVAIRCELTDIIPTECGCQRQIGLFSDLGCWEESDDYMPLPGDIIYYSSSGKGDAENTAWSDHVGIVVGTYKNRIRLIEGNYMGRVAYRTINAGAPEIRGYALPDYSSKTQQKLPVE